MCKKLHKFIAKANVIHNDFYTYLKVNYTNSKTKVIITCPNHGDFPQSPTNHIQKHGCPDCGKKRGRIKMTDNLEKFIIKSNKIHSNKYSYDKSVYVNSHSKIEITCLEHGNFWQLAYVHSQGHNCPKCAKEEVISFHKDSKEDFLIKAKNVHGDTYDYTKSFYIANKDKIIITCKKHGDFIQEPTAHLQGQGCITCFRYRQSKNQYGPTWSYKKWQKTGGESKNFDSFKVYIIRCWNDEEEFYKIGKTYRTLKKRFPGTKIPYNYEVIKIIEDNCGVKISKLENKLQKDNKKHKYLPKISFGGMYECFSNLNGSAIGNT